MRGKWEESQLVSGPIMIEFSRKKGADMGHGIQRKLEAGSMLEYESFFIVWHISAEEISIAASAVDGKPSIAVLELE
jgi:hypothetical protein